MYGVKWRSDLTFHIPPVRARRADVGAELRNVPHSRGPVAFGDTSILPSGRFIYFFSAGMFGRFLITLITPTVFIGTAQAETPPLRNSTRIIVELRGNSLDEAAIRQWALDSLRANGFAEEMAQAGAEATASQRLFAESFAVPLNDVAGSGKRVCLSVPDDGSLDKYHAYLLPENVRASARNELINILSAHEQAHCAARGESTIAFMSSFYLAAYQADKAGKPKSTRPP